MADEQEDGLIGKVFGSYRIIRKIGSGGFGNVYLAEHTILEERLVAIKQMHTHLASKEERTNFLEEARLLEKLQHPCIMHFLDVGIHEGFPYMVAEYAPQGSLRDRLRKQAPRPLSLEDTLVILSQVGEGLEFAHKQHIIHRDLKPENILFNARGDALLADFGVATTLSTASFKYVTVVGTPTYMAPEQFQNAVSKESDQYSLGCIAYELLTGRPPFTANDFFAMGFQHMSKAPIPPRQLNPLLPKYIEWAVLKAMAKQRTDRHSDIRAFIAALHTPLDPQLLVLPAVSDVPTSGMLLTTQADDAQAPTAIQPSAHETPRLFPATSSTGQTQRNGAFAAAPVSQGPMTPPPVTAPTSPTIDASASPPPPLTSSALTPLNNEENIPTYKSNAIWPSLETGATGEQGAIADMPTTYLWESATPFAAGEVTAMPLPMEHTNTQMLGHSGASGAIPLPVGLGMAPGGVPAAPLRPTRATGRSWPLIVIATLLIIVGIVSASTFVIPGLLPKPQPTPTGFVIASTTTVPTGITAQLSPTTAGHTPTPHIKATATAIPIASPTAQPTPTLGPPSPTPTPTLRPTPTPTPTPQPTHETLSIPFVGGIYAATTKNVYSRTVSVYSCGDGTAWDVKGLSDTFYVYDYPGGTPFTPWHKVKIPNWVLVVNGNSIETYLNGNSIPGYNANHCYSFHLYNLPAGHITFGVGDTYQYDNSGGYTITVTQA